MAAYGGDEVSALVLDVGSFTTKAGYAGDDTPQAVFSSALGYTAKHESKKYAVGDVELSLPRPHMDIISPFKEGQVTNWEAWEQLVDHALHGILRTKPADHPILMVEPSVSTRESREKFCEIMFEKYDVPAFYLTKSAVASSFAFGRSSSLVIDLGHQSTTITPVVDGYILKRQVTQQFLAGASLNTEILKQLASLGIDVTPTYRVADKKPVGENQPPNFRRRTFAWESQEDENGNPAILPSYDAFSIDRAICDYKEAICQVYETTYNPQAIAMLPSKHHEFPDGYNRRFGAERFTIPELLFQPSGMSDQGEGSSSFLGLPQLALNGIQGCEADLRPTLYSNIILTGGTSLFSGLPDRLYNDLVAKSPACRVKIIAPGNTTERKFSAWIGGSILASLGTFHQMWISKSEYQESGKSIVEKRCL